VLTKLGQARNDRGFRILDLRFTRTIRLSTELESGQPKGIPGSAGGLTKVYGSRNGWYARPRSDGIMGDSVLDWPPLLWRFFCGSPSAETR